MEARSALDTKRSGKVIKLREGEDIVVGDAIANFSFDSDITPQSQPKVITIFGGASTGKSHLVSTLKEHMPVYVMDTEDRYAAIAQKFGITTWKHIASFEEAFTFVRYIIKNNLPKGVVVFDSATDIKTYAEQRTLLEEEAQVIGKARNWGKVWDKMDWFLDTLKDAGHWIVFTARESEIYKGDQPTGEVKANAYSRVEYWSDMIIQCRKDGTRVITKPLLHQLPQGLVVGYDMTLMDILKAAKVIS